jgi:nitrile hydratase subunit alpha
VSEHHGHDHDHDHDHDHGHHPDAPDEIEARALALQSLLIEKGILSEADVDRVIALYEKDVGPMIGAHVVARAWSEPDYKRRLLEDAPAAVRELGYHYPASTQLVVLENRPGVHNLVVCTLCSCYPWAVLGLPPTWYKSAPYRSRAVSEPRAILKEFGLELPEETAVNVWDSSSDLRYLVLPERPAGTEGWSEEQLAAIVTRDAMIGVGLPRVPAEAGSR